MNSNMEELKKDHEVWRKDEESMLKSKQILRA